MHAHVASNQGRRINAIDADEDITLVNVQDDVDNEMFDVNALNGEEEKGKRIMIEEPVKPMKKTVQIILDEEVALKLQVEFDEEERLEREKVEKEKEANIAFIERKGDVFQYKVNVAEGVNAASEEVSTADGINIIVGESFLREVGIKARRFDGMITIYNGDDEVTYQMVRSHPRFKHHTNEQCNKIPPLLKVSEKDEKNGISYAYQKLKGFYKGVLNLGPDYIRDAKTEEWLTRGHNSVHEME
ncbi:hypothetical protein Tco_1384546 [Tanacetum coccineum]